MADQYHLVAIAAMACHLEMHLGHQRAGGIENLQLAMCRLLLHCAGYSVGTENNRAVVRYFVQLVNEDGTALFETLHHEPVVHHLVAYVDRGAECVERLFNDFDGAVHAGTKTAGICQRDLHVSLSISARSAWPRWLMAFFTSDGSSAALQFFSATRKTGS